MTRVKTVSREKYAGFRDKAEQYYEGMRSEYEQGRYGNCVTMAVHSAISWVDAFTVFRLGKKSSAQNHAEAISLLKEARVSDYAQRTGTCEMLYQLIEMKTPAEYENIGMSKGDAEKAKRLCEKIRTYMKDELKRAEVLSP